MEPSKLICVLVGSTVLIIFRWEGCLRFGVGGVKPVASYSSYKICQVFVGSDIECILEVIGLVPEYPTASCISLLFTYNCSQNGLWFCLPAAMHSAPWLLGPIHALPAKK